MNKTQFVSVLNCSAKLVRTEYQLTQDQMSRVLGLSKKTLVDIEKGRTSLGWAGAVALCTLFSESQVLAGLLGGEASDLICALAFEQNTPYRKRKNL